jgi:serine/threonine protein kinase
MINTILFLNRSARFAMKELNQPVRSPKDIKEYQDEINILEKLDHKNILKYVDSFLENERFYIITEYCHVSFLVFF